MRHAAIALLEAKGDLRKAVAFAERAAGLGPGDHRNHEALGRALLAANLGLRARRVLAHAVELRARREKAAAPAPLPAHVVVRVRGSAAR